MEHTAGFTAYVASYGGWNSERKLIEHAADLRAMLDDAGVAVESTHYYTAGYDSPFRLLNRHNEVRCVTCSCAACSSSMRDLCVVRAGVAHWRGGPQPPKACRCAEQHHPPSVSVHCLRVLLRCLQLRAVANSAGFQLSACTQLKAIGRRLALGLPFPRLGTALTATPPARNSASGNACRPVRVRKS